MRSLVQQLRELSLRNQELESALELARKKVAFYESVDPLVQDAMVGALRALFEIRSNFGQAAGDQFASTSRDEALLREEADKLQAQRDALSAERDALRQSVDVLHSDLAREKARNEKRASERSQLLTDVAALEARLSSIREELGAQPPIAADGDDQRQPTFAVPGNEVSHASSPALPLPELMPPADVSTGLPRGNRSTFPDGASAVQLNGELELVVSPVHSFPKLVELEQALQCLPEVKSFYVRDFRYGVATLLVRLASPELRENLLARLETLPGWSMAILTNSPRRVEAKVGA
ncbi:MAG: hypothetical protein HY675_03610 [Chloroflexi bacterium]|nr:hypothetical protein [Chloroflexota bacterium]